MSADPSEVPVGAAGPGPTSRTLGRVPAAPSDPPTHPEPGVAHDPDREEPGATRARLAAETGIPADAWPPELDDPLVLGFDEDGEWEWLERERLDGRAARASLYARFRRGPLWRGVARADGWGMRLIRRQARSRRITRQVRRFSRSGEHGIAWLVIGGVGIAVDRPRRARWSRATATVGGAYLVNAAIKQVARRPRPEHPELPPLVGTPGSMSFPSSHAASSFAAAAAYRTLLPRAPLYVGATAMAVSRVHLGVHYPSDIAVGATLGTIIGRLVCRTPT